MVTILRLFIAQWQFYPDCTIQALFRDEYGSFVDYYISSHACVFSVRSPITQRQAAMSFFQYT